MSVTYSRLALEVVLVYIGVGGLAHFRAPANTHVISPHPVAGRPVPQDAERECDDCRRFTQWLFACSVGSKGGIALEI